MHKARRHGALQLRSTPPPLLYRAGRPGFSLLYRGKGAGGAGQFRQQLGTLILQIGVDAAIRDLRSLSICGLRLDHRIRTSGRHVPRPEGNPYYAP